VTTIDSHQHFWDPAKADYPWMTPEVEPLCRRFGPDHLLPLIRECGIERTVVVQARSDLEETREFLTMAASSGFVAGVVGWVDLASDQVGDMIDSLVSSSHGGYLVGIRHQVENEPDPEWLLRATVLRGLREVGKRNLAYDLLIKPRHLQVATKVVQSLPDLRFVLDHVAKPQIAEGVLQPWQDDLKKLAQLPNVWCKVSGMMGEAGPDWSPSQLQPYVNCVFEAFGSGRIMFGSDWPVSTLRGTYAEILRGTEAALPVLSKEESAGVFGLNAIQAYRLSL